MFVCNFSINGMNTLNFYSSIEFLIKSLKTLYERGKILNGDFLRVQIKNFDDTTINIDKQSIDFELFFMIMNCW
jgi:hypothetical protein